jgi:hypothetical protein
VIHWLNETAVVSVPGRCAWCGGPGRPAAVVLPLGTDPPGQVWLHSGCWSPWHDARQTEAERVLAEAGLIGGAGISTGVAISEDT